MKPFKINRNSWHYKLNKHFLQDANMHYYWEPNHNDFCSYWRATIFRLSVVAFFTSFLIFILAAIGFAVYTDPVGSLIVIGIIVGMFAAAVGIVWYSGNRKKKEPSQSLIAQKYRAYKEKICPTVEFEE